MRVTVAALRSDVLARLGEISRPRVGSGLSDVPWPEDVVAVKVGSLLGEVGGGLIAGASADELGGGVSLGEEGCAMRLMPCGLYAAEVRLPGGFLRLSSAKLAGWRHGAAHTVPPGASGWGRQWSASPGIAGCPERPVAYLEGNGRGLLLRLVGSVSPDDSIERLTGWCVPAADADGGFEFPQTLYPRLVGGLAAGIAQ